MSEGFVDEQTPQQECDDSPSLIVSFDPSTEAGQRLEVFRPYLLKIAMAELSDAIQGKIGASDIVQETIIKGYENYTAFRGSTNEEFAGWLRTILLRIMSNWHKVYRAQKRDLSLEVPTDVQLVPPTQQSPSEVALTREQKLILDAAISRLPNHYRQAILLRHRENLTFSEIGIRIGNSEEAARKTWARAVEQLKQELQQHGATIS